MWLQACLNGDRTKDDHPHVPVTPEEIAADAGRIMEAGAVSIHVHPRNEAGRESLEPDATAAALSAIRKACPGMEIGLSTAEDIEPDLSRRLDCIRRWTVLPEFVSINLCEPHAGQVIALLVERGIGLEAGISTEKDARLLLSLGDTPWFRFLLEPWESDPAKANQHVDAIEKVLLDQFPHVPRLIHGSDDAAWPLLTRAFHTGHTSRIGLEDTLVLPNGEPAPDNAALVRAAKAIETRH